MRTAIMTDTNSGIPASRSGQDGLYVVPMPVIIDGESYLEGIDVSHEELYAALRAGRAVHSSQPAPDAFLSMWDQILSSGYDAVVYIPMSSALSGSCQMAENFAASRRGQVLVADNRRISVTLFESVHEALRMAARGMSASEIKASLEAHAADSSIYITVNSLEYLKRSGRVTAAGAAVASVLNLKPVLTIQGGKLDAFAKVRGMKSSERRMLEALKEDVRTRFSAFPPERIRLGAAGTFECPEDAEEWLCRLREAFPGYTVYYQPLSCSIACHVGIDAAGVGVRCIGADA